MLIAGQAWVPQSFDAGVIATILAALINAAVLLLFFEVIRLAGPTFFAQFNYLAVPAGAAWGTVIFREHLSLYYFLAMLLMFIGMFLRGRFETRCQAQSPPSSALACLRSSVSKASVNHP
jgi:drug/metabolite transporter (DMT)-like permease